MSEKTTIRKVFICKGCECVYADDPVSQCDCMAEAGFTEGVMEYPATASILTEKDKLIAEFRKLIDSGYAYCSDCDRGQTSDSISSSPSDYIHKSTISAQTAALLKAEEKLLHWLEHAEGEAAEQTAQVLAEIRAVKSGDFSDYVHRSEVAEQIAVLQSQVDNADKNLEQVRLVWKSRAESAEASNLNLVTQIGELSRNLGLAEGKLLASEKFNLIEDWKNRAESAEAKVRELERVFDRLFEILDGSKWDDLGPLRSLRPSDEKYVYKSDLLSALQSTQEKKNEA